MQNDIDFFLRGMRLPVNGLKSSTKPSKCRLRFRRKLVSRLSEGKIDVLKEFTMTETMCSRPGNWGNRMDRTL